MIIILTETVSLKNTPGLLTLWNSTSWKHSVEPDWNYTQRLLVQELLWKCWLIWPVKLTVSLTYKCNKNNTKCYQTIKKLLSSTVSTTVFTVLLHKSEMKWPDSLRADELTFRKCPALKRISIQSDFQMCITWSQCQVIFSEYTPLTSSPNPARHVESVFPWTREIQEIQEVNVYKHTCVLYWMGWCWTFFEV